MLVDPKKRAEGFMGTGQLKASIQKQLDQLRRTKCLKETKRKNVSPNLDFANIRY